MCRNIMRVHTEECFPIENSGTIIMLAWTIEYTENQLYVWTLLEVIPLSKDKNLN